MRRVESLYQAVEVLSLDHDFPHLTDLFASYAKVLTGARKTVFRISDGAESRENGEDTERRFAVRGPRTHCPEDVWAPALEELWASGGRSPAHRPFVGACRRLVLDLAAEPIIVLSAPVRSPEREYGYMAIMKEEHFKDERMAARSLNFLASLAAVVLDRRRAQRIQQDLLIAQEQNRIAFELHDCVSQELFHLMYSLHGLTDRPAVAADPDLRNVLTLLAESAGRAMREMRRAVQRLDSRWTLDRGLVQDLNSYLLSLGTINGIEARLQYSDLVHRLPTGLHSAVYRIVKEAASNSIRHGNCRMLEVDLRGDRSHLVVSIRDDGTGFDADAQQDGETGPGLGLVSLRELVRSLGGSLSVGSEAGVGTIVTAVLPVGEEPADEGSTGK